MDKKIKLKRQSASVNKKKSRRLYILPGIIILILIGYLYIHGDPEVKQTQYAKLEGDLKIVKSDVPVEAKFYPFSLDGTNMEVLTLKASDGSIRTALNTCQVCFDSGKGYYVQDPNTKELVCKNCGNRFSPERVEVVKGGCNPVPIMKENKTEDGTNITISRSVLEKDKYMFARWKRG